MADYQYLGIEQADAVWTLTISNPPANMLSRAVLTELDIFLETLVKNPVPKALVITGAGSFFVVGADIKEISEIKNGAEGEEAARLGQRVFDKLERLPVPTIVAVNGHCLGGGNEMAMACTVRIASDRARFGQPEINLGIIPGFGGTQRLARLVGKSRALELCLTGEMINAQTALQIGLVSQVAPEEEVLKKAQGLAKKMASKSRPAIERILRVTREGLAASQEEGLEMEAKSFGELCGGADMKEGLSAFLEKRRPKFQDR
ncbi:MAG: enoyl-CoA hydratase [Candidatus Omnitrophica bacterium CG11_big_fil_rev_8_21_14_0_20_64_10]|nr:MAG: enoyl-CoA hydratase [Candidatus Omnitrophica bacterium CG11_big_fil_rev_8_21_14_0_20_64_10]